MDRLGIKEDRNGGAWIYHYGNGIFHIRPDGRVRQLATEEDFPGYKVDCFHEDREGNLWAGVDRGGLVRIREQHFTVLAPGDPAFAKSAVSVAEDSEGALWVGTFGSGLYRVLDDTWRSIPLPIGSGREFVFSVFPDKNGRVWVSAGGEDLYVGTNGNFKPASPPVHGVKALLPASDGRLWIGTKSGLCCLSDEGFRQFTPEDGVKRLDVRALAEDSNGVIWAGAGDGTLYRIESDSITSHSPDDDLTGQPIWSLLADDDGTIWVGTFRGGLMRFRDGKFVRYTEKNGLPDDVICQILDGGDGCLWIGSQRGIFRVPKWELESFTTRSNKSISCTAYGRFDGLPSVECSGSYQPAAWRASDGRLLFTTLKGVVSVLPEELNPNRLPPPVVIEEVLLDGRAARIETKTQDDEEVRMLDVPPGQRQLEVRFTALSFVSPDRVRFRYKLDGMDSQWNEAGGRRSVNYNFLKPGRYMFHVTACNNDGVWNDLGTTLAIHVLPQWYQQWWFLPMISAVALVMVSVGVRQVVMRRVRGELQRVERQRAVELDRARIAKDIHDDLGAGLTHITLLSEVARRSPLDNVHGHLNHISDMARELTRAMDETVWAVNPKNDSLEGLMTYVTKFAQEYLNVAGIRCRLDLPAQLPPYTLDAELRHNVYLAIKETLNNVVKHAHASEVWLRLSFQRHGFSLVLEDDGCGLPTAGKPSDTQIGRISTGHGLSNLQKRLSASGGRCVITSEPGKGTRVEFIVEGVAAAGLARNGD
jgi:signal transduction histidine kinase/sugar lactone lactonase YvrE